MKRNNKNTLLATVLIGALLLAALVPVGSFASVEPTPEETLEAHLAITMGDVNDDHTVNAKDALLALQVSVGKLYYIPNGFGGTNGTNVPFEADCSGDGIVNAEDALQILQIAVGKRQEEVTFLAPEEFSSTAYPLEEDEVYVAPQVLKNADDLEQAALPLSVKTKLKAFDFKEQSLLIFSDSITVFGIPTAVQVAVHHNRALVRYEYEEPLQRGQYLLAVAVPSGLELSSFYIQPNASAMTVQPTLYTLEYEVDGMIEIGYPTYEVVTTKEEALEWIVFMKQYDLTDEAMSNLLFYRAESGFFEKNQMVVWFDYGKHTPVDTKNRVEDIEVSDTMAILKMANSVNKETGEQPRFTFRMRLLDLPKEKVVGCNEFVFQVAPKPGDDPTSPVTPTDLDFSYQVYHVGLSTLTGLYGYATGASYLETYDQWEQYSQGIRGSNINPAKEKYNTEYFENKSLIVFEGKRKTASPVQHTVTAVSYQDGVVTIAVSEREETGRAYTDDVYENFCIVELKEHLGSRLEGIRFVVNYREDQVDGSGNVVGVVTEETLEYTYYYDSYENQWV